MKSQKQKLKLLYKYVLLVANICSTWFCLMLHTSAISVSLLKRNLTYYMLGHMHIYNNSPAWDRVKLAIATEN